MEALHLIGAKRRGLARTVGIRAALWCAGLIGAAAHAAPNANLLKQLSVEELMNLEVRSVSRRPEKLSDVASALQVITGEAIIRSGAAGLPEALRLAPNLQVAQVNSSQWAISARGFDNVLANKLLVLIDGRTVYTPLYAGVFWDAQQTLLEDVDRIEVISGPGGTLWGANAVNGVISVATKSSDKTQGLFLSGGIGDELRNFAQARYGGQLAQNIYYRIYGLADNRDDTRLLSGADAGDAWRSRQTGFRVDADLDDDWLTLQSDWYDANPNPDGTIPTTSQGGNVLARWRHALSERSATRLQLYYDKTRRDFGNGFAEYLDTYDLDWQHRLPVGDRQEIVWGLDVRRMDHQVANLPLFKFLPAHKVLHLYSAFAQDEIRLFDDAVRFTLGSKFEHNDYTGLEIQPNVRVAWNPTANHTIWAAVSRAVRTPARIDRDFNLYLTPTLPLIEGDDFQSETVRAHELGWRLEPRTDLALSLATFYNEYDDIRSAEPGPPPFNIPITFGNGVMGETYGLEIAATYQANERWKLRGGYTWLDKQLRLHPDSRDNNRATAESDDPENQLLLQSILNLPHGLQFDSVLRYVDAHPDPRVPRHFDADVRLAWALDYLEVAVIGRNLLEDRHQEFIPSSPSPRDIERSVYGKVTWRY